MKQKAQFFLPMIFLAILEVLVGIFLLVNPEGITKVFIVIFGVIMLIIGVFGLISYLRGRKNGENRIGGLIGTIIALVLGLISIFASNWILTLVSLLAVVFGILLILGGIVKFSSFAQVKKSGLVGSGTVLMLISGIIMIIFGVILVIRPFGTIELLLRIAGILLIIEAVLDLISVFLSMRGKKTA